MTLRRLRLLFISAKSTVLLLCALAVLLLLNVAVPQESVLGAENFSALVEGSGPVARFFLDTLGFGRMSTSPVFLTVLGLFFLNLTLVLLARVGPTFRRIALRPRSDEKLRAWARLEESLRALLPDRFNAGHGTRTLRGFGYHVRRPGDRSLSGVKHRTAPLGFLLFHLSFFLLCAGGVAVYYTRFVGIATLTEGEAFSGAYADVIRQPPLGGAPPLAMGLVEVDPRFERGEPVHLGAKFRFRTATSAVGREARVNAPARWGATSVLVEQAGLAPVLWLQDARGFTVERVAAPARTRGGPPTRIPMADRQIVVVVHPLDDDAPFPTRVEFTETSLRLEVLRGEEALFDGRLRPGEGATLGGGAGRIVLEELRYWLGFRVIHERGGSVLIAGFVAGVVGLVWRLMLYRREVALTWDDNEIRLIGRAEYFSERFRRELDSILSILTAEAERRGGERG
jgi:cytochrome c biogenesis protein ResB